MVTVLICVLILLFAVCIGWFFSYRHFSTQLSHKEQLDKEIIQQNEKNRLEKNKIQEDVFNLKEQKTSLLTELQSITEVINKNSMTADQAVATLNTRMDEAAEHLSVEYNQLVENYKTNYFNVVKEYNEDFIRSTEQDKIELQSLNEKIDNAKNIWNSIVESSKREEQKRIEKDFYKLNLTNEDIEEIAVLRKATKLLKSAEPINKVIWKVYYEKPYTDLIGRVVGSGIHCGIYKITNLENNMCYVGQAVDIASRWKQHIKRGIGAEAPTRNKLYPAMMAFGVENFSFEIIEECDKSKLNELEDYWQDFYKAKEFGYSIK